MIKERIVEAKRLIGKKTVNGKEYVFEYYSLPLNLYIPKAWVEKYGSKFYLKVDEEKGIITIQQIRGEKNEPGSREAN